MPKIYQWLQTEIGKECSCSTQCSTQLPSKLSESDYKLKSSKKIKKINWKALSFIKVTAHKETQVSFGSIQKSSVCFGCPQLGTLQHTTNFRNSLAPFKGNFILDQWCVYGMHVFFLIFKEHILKISVVEFGALAAEFHALRFHQNRSNMITTGLSTSRSFRTFGLSVSPFALLNVSITSLVILYTWSFSYPRSCLVEHVSNLSLLNPELVVE